jgi:hypothetical protein
VIAAVKPLYATSPLKVWPPPKQALTSQRACEGGVVSSRVESSRVASRRVEQELLKFGETLSPRATFYSCRMHGIGTRSCIRR